MESRGCFCSTPAPFLRDGIFISFFLATKHHPKEESGFPRGLGFPGSQKAIASSTDFTKPPAGNRPALPQRQELARPPPTRHCCWDAPSGIDLWGALQASE